MCTIPKLFELLDSKNIKAFQLSKDTGISSGNISDWKSGRSSPNVEALIKIADFFDCSADYLLNRTNNPQSHKCAVTTGDISVSHNSVVGDGHVGVSIHNGTDTSEQAAFLLNIFNNLNLIDKSKLLIYADELNKNK